MTDSPVLGQRALNRALLERQQLLSRATMPALAMIEHLVGMQAQAPLASYLGLWTRLAGFQPAELAELMTSRRTVRATLMRGTIHLVSDTDALTLRPLIEPVVARGAKGNFGKAVAGVDLDAVVKYARELMEQAPRNRPELRQAFAERWPDVDAEALSVVVSFLVPNVQITPRGVWGSNGPAAWTTLEQWLGRPLDPAPSIAAIAVRYLRAFGPASVMDLQAWCGLTRLREVVEGIDGLRTFRSETGTLLYDVADGPLPDPDTPAPARFLPEYDNVLFGHADRTRVNPDGRRIPLPAGVGGNTGTVLIDGTYRANWRLYQERGYSAIEVYPFGPSTETEVAELEHEAGQLLAFVAPDTYHQGMNLHGYP